jgi:hypothetical protein
MIAVIGNMQIITDITGSTCTTSSTDSGVVSNLTSEGKNASHVQRGITVSGGRRVAVGRRVMNTRLLVCPVRSFVPGADQTSFFANANVQFTFHFLKVDVE